MVVLDRVLDSGRITDSTHIRQVSLFNQSPLQLGSDVQLTWFLLIQSTAGADQEEEGVESEPEFIQSIGNVTVAQGRDAVLSCSIGHLNDYTVEFECVARQLLSANWRASIWLVAG